MAASVRIRRATEADIPTMIDVADAAFGRGNSVVRMLFPLSRESDPDKRWADEVAWRTDNMRRGMAPGNDTKHYIVACLGGGEGGEATDERLVGWALWEALDKTVATGREMAERTARDAEAAGKDKDVMDLSPETERQQQTKQNGSLPSSMDPDGMKRLLVRMEEGAVEVLGKNWSEKKWSKFRRPRRWNTYTKTPSHPALMTIAVDPKHQGKRIGRRLLDWGIEQATAEGKDIYLLSTAAGRRLYIGAGFQELGVIDLFGTPNYHMLLRT